MSSQRTLQVKSLAGRPNLIFFLMKAHDQPSEWLTSFVMLVLMLVLAKLDQVSGANKRLRPPLNHRLTSPNMKWSSKVFEALVMYKYAEKTFSFQLLSNILVMTAS